MAKLSLSNTTKSVLLKGLKVFQSCCGNSIMQCICNHIPLHLLQFLAAVTYFILQDLDCTSFLHLLKFWWVINIFLTLSNCFNIHCFLGKAILITRLKASYLKDRVQKLWIWMWRSGIEETILPPLGFRDPDDPLPSRPWETA